VAELSITWLGHSTLRIEVGGASVITDPVLTHRVGPLSRAVPKPSVRQWADPDVVLLSHLHHDHAHIPSLIRTAPAPILTGAANRAWVIRHRLPGPHPDATPDDWVAITPSVGIRLVRADHESRPMPHRPNDAHGFLIRHDLPTGGHRVVWFAGDTSLYPEMDRLGDLAGADIDVALLPIGGWGPRLSPGHLGPAEAAAAAALSGARHVIGIHYGTLYPRGWPTWHLEWMTRPLADLAGHLSVRAPAATLHPLSPGGTANFSSRSGQLELDVVDESGPA